jgi:hypothetical protein
MDWGELVDGFELKENFILDDQVGSEAAIESEVFVTDGDFLLRGDRETSIGEFEGEAFLINRFQKSRTKFPMHSHSASNNRFG